MKGVHVGTGEPFQKEAMSFIPVVRGKLSLGRGFADQVDAALEGKGRDRFYGPVSSQDSCAEQRVRVSSSGQDFT